MMRTRVGVAGIGFGQQVHVPAFRLDPRCEVAAICASTKDRAALVAKRLGIGKAFGDWREMLADPEIDAVTLAVPPILQPEIAMAALERGKPVFCEKPLAPTAAAAVDLAQAARRARLPNMVDFAFLEIPPWRRARAILVAGGIGALRHMAVSWNVEIYAIKHKLAGWKTTRQDGGGALNAFVSHIVYCVEQLAGPIGKISARLFNALGEVATNDTLASLCLELASGVPVTVSASCHAFLGTGHRLEIYGDQGTVILENRSADYVRGFKLWHGTREGGSLKAVECDDAFLTGAADGRVAVVSRLAGKFLDWIETGTMAEPTFESGARVQICLEAALRSHREGRWVAVEPVKPGQAIL